MLADRFRLDGRVAVVTGAGRGIGAACARALAEFGADVAITARTEEQLEEVASAVRAGGQRALVFPGDVNDVSVLDEFVAATVAEYGRLDIVVNNAGGSMPQPFLDTSVGSFEFASTPSIMKTPLVAERGRARNDRAHGLHTGRTSCTSGQKCLSRFSMP